MGELAKKIRAARLAKGWSQAAVGKALGISQPAYRKIETGDSERSRYEYDAARLLGVPIGHMAPVVGYVGAGAEAHFYADADEPDELVPAPDNSTPSTVAVEIRGESLGALFDGWLVFYDRVESPVTPALIGQMCVVGLPDGRVLVKTIQRAQAPGLFHLRSNFEPPIFDVPVEWAAPVKAMAPRRSV